MPRSQEKGVNWRGACLVTTAGRIGSFLEWRRWNRTTAVSLRVSPCSPARHPYDRFSFIIVAQNRDSLTIWSPAIIPFQPCVGAVREPPLVEFDCIKTTAKGNI